VTATAVMLSRIPRALLRPVLDEHPRVELRLFEQAVARRDATIRHLCSALTGSVRARLAGQLARIRAPCIWAACCPSCSAWPPSRC
jgi:CRP-like cAMP-binding protein